MSNPLDALTDEQLDGLPEGLRAEVRKNKDLRAELEASQAKAALAEREAAFAKAGVPDTPLAQQLAKTYEGDNDPTAVKAFFEGLGVSLAPETPAQSGPTEAELEAQRRLAQVGSAGAGTGDVRFEDAINSAKSVDEVMNLIAQAPEGATSRIDGREVRIRVPIVE